MGIEVLIFEKSTRSRRAPFDTLGIYAKSFRKPVTNDNIEQWLKKAGPHRGGRRPSAMNLSARTAGAKHLVRDYAIHQQLRPGQCRPHREKKS
jgi:hypothetical protein